MEIQNMLSSPLYAETLSKFRDKAKENARQSFADFIDSEKSQSPRTDSNIPANITADNGVKSAVMMSRLSSQATKSTGATTVIPEVERRNRDSTNPANQALAKAAEPLLEYLKDYPRGETEKA